MNASLHAKKLVVLMFGFFLVSFGMLLTIHSGLGAAPWDLLQLGIAGRTGFTLGQVSQSVGALIILMDIVLKEIPGWGTILNMYFIGYFLDFIENHTLVPDFQGPLGRAAMLFAGILGISWGTYFYLSAGWGAGPRDGLMLGLAKRFRTKVSTSRICIEVCVTAGGLLLGSKPGMGTILIAFLVGPCLGLAYRLTGKDPKTRHQTLLDSYRALVSRRKPSSI